METQIKPEIDIVSPTLSGHAAPDAVDDANSEASSTDIRQDEDESNNDGSDTLQNNETSQSSSNETESQGNPENNDGDDDNSQNKGDTDRPTSPSLNVEKDSELDTNPSSDDNHSLSRGNASLTNATDASGDTEEVPRLTLSTPIIAIIAIGGAVVLALMIAAAKMSSRRGQKKVKDSQAAVEKRKKQACKEDAEFEKRCRYMEKDIEIWCSCGS